MARAYARADRMVAEREAEAAKARAEYEAFMASKGLPVQPAPDVAAAPTNLREIGAVLKQSFEGFKDAVGETFDDRRDVLDPGDANLNKPPAEVEDEAERARIGAAERAGRERARAPFEAAAPPAIAFTRFATTGRQQLEDVVQALRSSGLAAHPERVFGVYRVPDRHDLRRNKEADAVVEWEIAHAPGALAPAADECPDRRLQALGPLGGAAAGRAVGARRGRRRRAGRPRPREPGGLLRAAPAAQRARPQHRGEHELDPGRRGRAALHPAAGRDHRGPAGDDGARRRSRSARRRSTSRCSTGRRSRRGCHRTATARSASRPRSRTCRAPGAS